MRPSDDERFAHRAKYPDHLILDVLQQTVDAPATQTWTVPFFAWEGLANPGGVVHGGAQMAVASEIGVTHLRSIRSGSHAELASITTSFFLPADVGSSGLTMTSHVLRVGSRVAILDHELRGPLGDLLTVHRMTYRMSDTIRPRSPKI